MLVRFTNPLTVVADRLPGRPRRNDPVVGPPRSADQPLSGRLAEALALAAANANNQIVLDDGIFVTPADDSVHRPPTAPCASATPWPT